MSLLQKFRGYFKKKVSADSDNIVDIQIDEINLSYEAEDINEKDVKQSRGEDIGEDEYEIVEREFLPAKRICPDCGGITLEGLDFCDKCGGELN